MPENRLTRLETQMTTVFDEQANLKRQQATVLKDQGDLKGDLRVLVEQTKALREDFDQLLHTLTDDQRERTRQRTAATWQKIAISVGLFTWFASTMVTIALAAGILGSHG